MTAPDAPFPVGALRLVLVHVRDRRPRNTRFQAELDRLNRSIVTAADALGWPAALVPAATVSTAHAVEQARAADAVVIAGGEDVDPRLYGGAEEYPDRGDHEPRADRTQIAIVRAVASSGIPLLGLCRGMQIMNVALGGSLIQHLCRTDLHRAPAGSESRFVASAIAWDESYIARPTPYGERSLLEDVSAAEPVYCTHHQAVAELARGLIPAARSADGVIEAIVATDGPLTGVQWHPEHRQAPPEQLRRLLLRLAHQREAQP